MIRSLLACLAVFLLCNDSFAQRRRCDVRTVRRVVPRSVTVKTPVVAEVTPVVQGPPEPRVPAYGPDWRERAVDYLRAHDERREFLSALDTLAAASGLPTSQSATLPPQGSSVFATTPVSYQQTALHPNDITALVNKQVDLAKLSNGYSNEANQRTNQLIGGLTNAYAAQTTAQINAQSTAHVLGELSRLVERLGQPGGNQRLQADSSLEHDVPLGSLSEPPSGLVQQFCVKCHGGSDPKAGIAMDSGILTEGDKLKALSAVIGKTMPPPEEKQPDTDERILLMKELSNEVTGS